MTQNKEFYLLKELKVMIFQTVHFPIIYAQIDINIKFFEANYISVILCKILQLATKVSTMLCTVHPAQ